MTGRRVRCDVCGDEVESLHPWDEQVCSCGSLTVSGGPKRRRVHWTAGPGSGWTDVPDEAAEDVPDEGADEVPG